MRLRLYQHIHYGHSNEVYNPEHSYGRPTCRYWHISSCRRKHVITLTFVLCGLCRWLTGWIIGSKSVYMWGVMSSRWHVPHFYCGGGLAAGGAWDEERWREMKRQLQMGAILLGPLNFERDSHSPSCCPSRSHFIDGPVPGGRVYSQRLWVGTLTNTTHNEIS